MKIKGRGVLYSIFKTRWEQDNADADTKLDRNDTANRARYDQYGRNIESTYAKKSEI